MRIIKIADFVSETEEITWLVDGLLPDVGWTLFYGLRGLGKTTFAMQLSASIQSGEDFMDMKTCQKRVLYIQADSESAEWRHMLARIAPRSEGLTVIDVPNKALGNDKYVDYLKTCVQMTKPGFVVFDSLYNLAHWNINTEQVLLNIGMMKLICSAVASNDEQKTVPYIPFMLIHHPPHSESRAAGHNSLGGNCSNEWSLLKNKMKIEKGRLVKGKEILLSRDEDGLWCRRQSEAEIAQQYNTPLLYDDVLDRPLL